MLNNKLFEVITEKERTELEKILVDEVNNRFRREELSENCYKYMVQLQEIKFITIMSIDEVEESARLTVDLLEELKSINNSGLNRSEFETIKMNNEKRAVDGNRTMKIVRIWNDIKTDRLTELVDKLDCLRKVEGARAWLIANPGLINAIYAVYSRLVDSFDDDKIYLSSAFFLMRAVMRMNSDEVEE